MSQPLFRNSAACASTSSALSVPRLRTLSRTRGPKDAEERSVDILESCKSQTARLHEKPRNHRSRTYASLAKGCMAFCQTSFPNSCKKSSVDKPHAKKSTPQDTPGIPDRNPGPESRTGEPRADAVHLDEVSLPHRLRTQPNPRSGNVEIANTHEQPPRAPSDILRTDDLRLRSACTGPSHP